MQTPPYFLDVVFLGCLSIETIINRKKEIFIERLGGNLLYAASAAKIWGTTSGLLSKVGGYYSESFIKQITDRGLNTQGIIRTGSELDHHDFYFVADNGNLVIDNPHKYFLELDQPIPKSLLGYSRNGSKLDSKRSCGDLSFKPEDIPSEYFDCRNLALCPYDYISHSLVPVEFRSRNNTRVFFHAANGYMHSSFFTEIPALVCGAELFFTTYQCARDLFLGKLEDLWEMLEFIASFNIETSVIHKPGDGFYVFVQRTNQKYYLPEYPVELVDPVGVEDAFFGGFVAHYLKNFDPVKAAAAGAVSASIKSEGSTPSYLLNTLPELAFSRMEKLMDEVASR